MPIAPTRRRGAWLRRDDTPGGPPDRDACLAPPSRAPRDTGTRLRTAQLAASYRQLPLAVLASSVNAALMVVVLGAGLTGLSTAYHSTRGALLLEQATRSGEQKVQPHKVPVRLERFDVTDATRMPNGCTQSLQQTQ